VVEVGHSVGSIHSKAETVKPDAIGKTAEVVKKVYDFGKKAFGLKYFKTARSNARLLSPKTVLDPFKLLPDRENECAIAMALRISNPYLPADLVNEIIGFVMKSKFLRDFGVDVDTAREVRRALNHNPLLKSAMTELRAAVTQLTNEDSSVAQAGRVALERCAEKLRNSLDAPVALISYVEAGLDAIVTATNPLEQFMPASNFLKMLSAFGIKTGRPDPTIPSAAST